MTTACLHVIAQRPRVLCRTSKHFKDAGACRVGQSLACTGLRLPASAPTRREQQDAQKSIVGFTAGSTVIDVCRRRSRVAWGLFRFNWRVLAGITGVIVASLVTSQFYIQPAGYVAVFAVAGVYWWFGQRGARSAAQIHPKVFFGLIALAQLVLAVPITVTLT